MRNKMKRALATVVATVGVGTISTPAFAQSENCLQITAYKYHSDKFEKEKNACLAFNGHCQKLCMENAEYTYNYNMSHEPDPNSMTYCQPKNDGASSLPEPPLEGCDVMPEPAPHVPAVITGIDENTIILPEGGDIIGVDGNTRIIRAGHDITGI